MTEPARVLPAADIVCPMRCINCKATWHRVWYRNGASSELAGGVECPTCKSVDVECDG